MTDAGVAHSASPESAPNEPAEPAEPAPAAIEAWGRIAARLERQFERIERAASIRLDRELSDPERVVAAEAATTLAGWLARLGLGSAADLGRTMASALAEPPFDLSRAIEVAAVVDDLRLLLQTAPTDLGAPDPDSMTVLVVGDSTAAVDAVVWVAASSGLDVIASPEGLGPLPDDEIDAILVFCDKSKGRVDTTAIRGLSGRIPMAPIVAVADALTAKQRLRLGPISAAVLDAATPPRAIVDELALQYRISMRKPSLALYGSVETLGAELAQRGITALGVKGPAELMAALDRQQAQGVLLPSSLSRAERIELTRLVRTDPRLRSALVVAQLPELDPLTVTRHYRAGADDVVSTETDPDELAVRVKAGLVGRARARFEADGASSLGTGGWASARALLDRLLTSSQRQGQVTSLAVVSRHPGTEADGPTEFELLGSEFREGDIVVARPTSGVVVALRGAPRHIAVDRMADALVRHGMPGTHRVGVAEFPYDGHTVEELIQACEAVRARAEEADGPPVVGTDWQPKAEQAPDVAIVDPDQTLASVLSIALEREQLRPLHLEDGAVALDYLIGPERNPLPRALLLEFDTPGVEGLQVLHRLRDSGVLNQLRVLMLSARMQESDIRRAFDLGAVDVIRKPFPASILMHRLRWTLGA